VSIYGYTFLTDSKDRRILLFFLSTLLSSLLSLPFIKMTYGNNVYRNTEKLFENYKKLPTCIQCSLFP
jgi:hypothetical protein